MSGTKLCNNSRPVQRYREVSTHSNHFSKKINVVKLQVLFSAYLNSRQYDTPGVSSQVGLRTVETIIILTAQATLE